MPLASQFKTADKPTSRAFSSHSTSEKYPGPHASPNFSTKVILREGKRMCWSQNKKADVSDLIGVIYWCSMKKRSSSFQNILTVQRAHRLDPSSSPRVPAQPLPCTAPVASEETALVNTRLERVAISAVEELFKSRRAGQTVLYPQWEPAKLELLLKGLSRSVIALHFFGYNPTIRRQTRSRL